MATVGKGPQSAPERRRGRRVCRGMDAVHPRPYILPPHMNRLLLAFLALLGVVAQAQPAAARVAEGAGVGVVASQVLAARAIAACAAAVVAAPLRPAAARLVPAPAVALPVAFAPAIRAVLTGIDRAAE